MQNRWFAASVTLLFLLVIPSLNAQNQLVNIIGPTTICQGDCATLSVSGITTPPSASTIQWTGPNGFTATGQSIVVCAPSATDPGSGGLGNTLLYKVTVVSANGAGIATDTHLITILPEIPFKIVSSNRAPCNFDSLASDNTVCEKVCPNTTVVYSLDTSVLLSGSIPPYWSIQGASSFTVNNPPFNTSVTVTWGGPGVGSVTVGIDGSQPGACFSPGTLCVTVVPEPLAQFTTQPSGASPLQVCKGQEVFFSNQSTGADSYEWVFSDNGMLTNTTNPSHVYSTPGNHTVTLIARSACLCADTVTFNITVLDADAPALDCIGTICPNTTATYHIASGCAPFTWSVTPNGAIISGGSAVADSITVQWGDGPAGYITLGAQACSGNICPLPSLIQVRIISDNAQIQGPDRVCPDAREVYSILPYGGSGFTWTVNGNGVIIEGQGTNTITVAWGSPANPAADQVVTVSYDNCYLGCGGQDSLLVKILSPFVLNGPVELCENASGNFSAKLTATNQPINCNWTLFGPSGNAVWTSATPVATVNPVFSAGSGIYQLRAIPANPAQTCGDQAEWVIRVAASPPKPGQINGISNICPNNSYTYEVVGVSSAYNVRWTVRNGAGAPQTLAGNPVNITWGANGPYALAAALVSTDGLGCISDTLQLPIQAINLGTLSGATLVCNESLAAYALPPVGNIPVTWSVSPASAGAVASGQGTGNAGVFWTEPGGHVVSVSVCGLNSIFPVTVLALPDPMVNTGGGVCPGGTATIQTTAAFAQYSWMNEAGVVVSTAAMPVLPAGAYALTVTDANGCVGNTEFSLDVTPLPNVNISTADATGFCNNSQTVSLTALTTNDGDYTYQWYQDGNPVGGNTNTYATNQYGNYTCQITNQFGCSAVAGPVVLFNYCGGGGGGFGFPGGGGSVCAPGTIDVNVLPTASCNTFNFSITGAPVQSGTASWVFGQSGAAVAGTSTADAPSFVFPNAGKYIARVIVTLANGMLCEALDSVNVLAVAQFDAAVDCPGENTTFKDISTVLPPNTLVTWAWNFDDPGSGAANTSVLNDPAHNFTAAGIFDVTLTVSTNTGCTSTTTQSLNIPASTPLNFSPPSSNCAGNALEFNGNGAGLSNINWNFGDPASGTANDADGNTVYHNFALPGTYVITATTTNIYGCTATTAQNLTIAPSTLSGNISPATPAPVCEGNTIILTAPGGAVAYIWSDSVTTTPTLTVGKEGIYRVTLTDANGCTYVPPPVRVEFTPAPDALIKALIENEYGQLIGTVYPQLNTCAGENVHLAAFGNGAYGYSWSGGNGNSIDVYFSDDRNNLLSVGTHLFTVTVTDFASGCTAVTAPFTVTVNPVPSGFSISAASVCAGATLQYSGPQPPNWQLIWNNGVTGPTLTTDAAGAFYIRVINEFGCEARSLPLAILPGPPIASIPAGCHRRCEPDTLCLPPMPTVVSIQWFFNGAAIPGATSTDFVAQQSGTYWAELTDVFGCQAQSDPLDLDLFQGSGDIGAQVWSDVNHNGIIDAADTLISGVVVQLLQGGTNIGQAVSDNNGALNFTNIPSTGYTLQADPAALSGNWQTIIGTANLTLSGCGDVENADFLIEFVCQPVSSSAQFSACAGDAIVYNGVQIPAGSTEVVTLTTPLGCDSIVTVSVVALPASAASLQVKTCPGEPYFYQGVPLFAGETQSFLLQNYLGCDSILTISVGALSNSASSLQVKVCPGETYDFFGTLVAPGQTLNITLQNYLGCDSVVTLSVSAYPALSGTEAASVCPGETFNYQGTDLQAGDVATFTLSSVITGCDSVVTVTVAAFPALSGTETANVCPGETFTYQGAVMQPGDVATFILSSVITGCDSVVTVSVLPLAASTGTLNVSACPGSSYNYNGLNIPAGSTQQITLVNAVGCDSVLTVNVAERAVAFTTLEVVVCPGASYDYFGTPVPAGATRTFVLVGYEGCDSTVTLVVNAYPALQFKVQTTASCPGSPTGALNINNISGGTPPYLFALDGGVYQTAQLFDTLSAGAYTLSVEDSNGCVFEQEASVSALPPLEVTLTDALLPCDTAAVVLRPLIGNLSGGLSFQWWNGAVSPEVSVTDIGNVWVEVSNQCETVRRDAKVVWADSEGILSYVYVPNVVAPQAENPANALFKPNFIPGVQVLSYTFAVFDRWGDKMFETRQTSEGWDTWARSKEMQPGVMVWYLEAKVAYCGREIVIKKEGDVTVVR
jgi:PKD repeat protein